jgi:gliding motility-associated-like protein
LYPTVDSAGTYVLAVTDTVNACQSFDTLTVTADFTSPAAAIAPPDLLTCTDTLLTLDGTASSDGPGFSYQWQHDSGGILSGGDSLQPTISLSGTYRLTVTDTNNGCVAVDSAIVQQDTNVPAAAIAPPADITCAVPNVALDASNSSQNNNISLSWASADGHFLSGENSLQPTVDAAGTYTLSVLDTLNDCQAIASVTVNVDTLAPLAEAGDTLLLNCYQPTAALDGGSSTSGAGMDYSWSSPDGNILSGTQGLTPTVNEEGIYFLTVFNNQNGCQSLDSTTVALDFEAPVADIAAPGILTCTDTTLTLNGTASSSGAGFSYRWTHNNNGVLAGSETPEALIQEPGQYVLQVQNTGNGCLTRDTVLVQEDVEYPNVQIATPGRLSCARPALTLDGAGSSQGSGFELAWTTEEGNILGNTSGLEAVVNGAGTYQLRVLDQSNNCSSAASVEVLIDTLPPVADAGPALALNCQQPAAMLDGSASASGADISYSWTTPDGNILNGSDTDSPLVDEAGTYQLLVFNADNGCSSEALVAVSKDVTPPVAAVPLPDTLKCNRLSVPLDASSSTGESLSFQWSTLNGQITDGANQALATVNAPGTYALLLTNTENFCQDTLQVTVAQDTLSPDGQIAAPPVLNCALTQTALIATADGNYTFNWSTNNGNILNGATSPQPLVNAPGQYELRLLDPSNGCTAELAVEIQQDTLSPVASVLPPMELNCERTNLTLDATASSTGPNLVYQWTSENGNILNGATSPQALVDAPGTYRFTIRNTVNFCTDSLQLSVTQDTLHPTVSITPPDTLDCVTPEVSLAGSSVGPGNDFAYSWSSNDGLILGGDNESTATAGEPGQYLLEVTDLNNQCRSEAQVSVGQDTLPPQVLITPADTLDCDVLQVTLDGSASSAGSEMSYQWSSTDGSLLGSTTTPSTLANTAGTYQLLILNTQNGCRDSATVSVSQDTVAPVVSLVPPEVLNCITSSVPLTATVSDAGPGFAIDWSGPAGGFANGTDGLSPEVVRPGNYSLTIENLTNGCRSTRSVLVAQDTVSPIADAGSDFVIPCFPELRQLDGSASSAGAIYSYSWATDNGVLENGLNTLTPTIDGPGRYTLSILNTQNGCSASDIVVVSQDIPQAAAELVQPLCFGDFGQLQIDEVQGGTPPYVYSVDGGGQFQSEPGFLALPPGTYEWVVQDVQGCEDRAAFTVEQPDSLIVRVVPEEVELQLGDSLRVNVESNYPLSALQDIAWQAAPGLSCYDCLNPVAMPLQTTDYYLTVSTADGCADQLRLRIYVDKGNPVYLPNVFSPNNDGANDLFFPQAKPGTVRNIRDFRLFDRWGEAVFQNQNFLPNDPSQGWDGRLRGERANTAVFAYFLEVEFIDGRVELLKGDVLLMR